MWLVGLNVDRRDPPRKNRTAEATANGKAGAPNQYGRYFDGLNTLNETPTLQEDDSPAATPVT
jgi:hypothetical protein